MAVVLNPLQPDSAVPRQDAVAAWVVKNGLKDAYLEEAPDTATDGDHRIITALRTP